MARAPKSAPELEALEGALWPDGWTTPSVALELKPAAADRTVRATITNPHFNTAYMRNTVRVALDGETAFADLMFAGHGVRIERFVPAKSPLLIEVVSEASLEPDALDDRPRGVWLKLENRPVEG